MAHERKNAVEEAGLESFPASDSPAWSPDPLPAAAQASSAHADWFMSGMIAGFIGFAVSAVLLAIAGLAQGGTPFLVPARLGAILFYGGAPGIEVGPMLAYQGLHLFVFVLLGLVMARLAMIAAHIAEGWYLLSIAFLFVVVHALALPFLYDDALRAVLPLWLAVLAGAASFTGMVIFLSRAIHPDPGLDDDPPE